MNEQKLKDQVNRGLEAEKVLKNPVYRDSYLVIKSDLLSKFETTRHDQSADRDELWRKLQALNWVQQEFERQMRDGERAQETLMEKIKNKFTGRK